VVVIGVRSFRSREFFFDQKGDDRFVAQHRRRELPDPRRAPVQGRQKNNFFTRTFVADRRGIDSKV